MSGNDGRYKGGRYAWYYFLISQIRFDVENYRHHYEDAVRAGASKSELERIRSALTSYIEGVLTVARLTLNSDIVDKIYKIVPREIIDEKSLIEKYMGV